VFHICTIANKLDQYAEMKYSFLEAGFDESRCRYSVFDNSKSNIYDPYITINDIRVNTEEPYIIFCHQDVLINQGHGFEQLLKVLKELDQLDPKWAVAGNSGFNSKYEHVVKITDPHNTPIWTDGFPQKIYSLDENFIVINAAADVACSSELSWFYFYATDLCLDATLKGYSCYAIDFHLTHLSPGKIVQHFWELQTKFENRWSNEFNFAYIQTPYASMILCKNKLIRYLLSIQKVRRWILSNRHLQKWMQLQTFRGMHFAENV
jgi:hypothetical protein